MFNLFKKKQSSSKLVSAPTLTVQPLCPLSINLERFVKGIDNVHIDVYLSPHFTNLSQHLIYELLNERSTNKKRLTDKPSPKVREKRDAFGNGYAQMLTTAIHRIKESKRIDSIQLFQIAVIKFVLTIHTFLRPFASAWKSLGQKKYLLKGMLLLLACLNTKNWGMTTFRYNLNGIELESAAYEKLQNEIVLRHLNIRFR